MNSYKYNSHARHYLTVAISNSLNIPYNDVYKTVKDIKDDIVTLHDGRKFTITLNRIDIEL